MGSRYDHPRASIFRSRAVQTLALAVIALPSAGCTLLRPQSHWYEPAPYTVDLPILGESDGNNCDAATAQYTSGQQADLAGDVRCIDHYLAAAMLAWPRYAGNAMATDGHDSALYESSVRAFVEAGNRFGRFNRRTGIVLTNGQVVPATYYGFLWTPDEFCTLLPVGSYASPRLSQSHIACGVGVPYVVLTNPTPQRPFTNASQPFAATIIVKPGTLSGGCATLEFYDPLRIDRSVEGLPLARDLTAPIAYSASRETDAWLDDFIRPGGDDRLDGLHMHEPFQPGKIPIVFVHGLASDPLTWAQLENELRAQPEIYRRYQFWFFRYDTGAPFLSSAAKLRQQLVGIRFTYDPQRCDPDLSRMVVVGHSMGGLVSKMQVTYSGDAIWRAAATRPFDSIITSSATRADLAAAFFFAPSPDIDEVIYIATPHRGAATAQRLVGRISSALVEERPERQAQYDQIVRDNPGIFREELSRHIPTSIDLLEPDSQILQATQTLPYRYGVRIHSVVGDETWSLGEGPSDGIVPVSSAYLPGVHSNLVVDARHTQVQRRSETVREIVCILTQHAQGN